MIKWVFYFHLVKLNLELIVKISLILFLYWINFSSYWNYNSIILEFTSYLFDLYLFIVRSNSPSEPFKLIDYFFNIFNFLTPKCRIFFRSTLTFPEIKCLTIVKLAFLIHYFIKKKKIKLREKTKICSKFIERFQLETLINLSFL